MSKESYWEILENKINKEYSRHNKAIDDIFEEIKQLDISEDKKSEYTQFVEDIIFDMRFS